MMTLASNKQSMKYSQQGARITIYEKDDEGNIIYEGYTDSDGNFVPYLDDDGNKIVSHNGYLLLIVDKISLIAAPVGAVTTPTLVGILGISFLYSCSQS